MTADGAAQVTRLLQELHGGDERAADRLMPLVYQELRAQAGRYLRSERSAHTLQPTALVHEAYLKLVDQRAARWENRMHFFRIAAQAMRRILVDHARRHKAGRRGGGNRVTLDEEFELPSPAADADPLDVIAVDSALIELAGIDERQARVVELRYFAGLDVQETADVLEVSAITVKRDWRHAKAWLFRRLQGSETTGHDRRSDAGSDGTLPDHG